MSRARARELAKTFLELCDAKGWFEALYAEADGAAIYAMVNCVTPGGSLLVIARGREPNDDPGSMPWPLTVSDLEPFVQSGLDLISFEDFFDREDPPVRRFKVQYRKPIEGNP